MRKILPNKIKDFNDFVLASNYFGIEINDNQLDLFKRYYHVLLDWNKKINLISRKEENVLEKHFLDSILFLPEIEGLINQTPTIFDIGSGGGFPAILLAIMKPNWHFTLCESIKKKANFLKHLVNKLELKNVEVINDRVENVRARHGVPQQNTYDFVTARAIGKLDKLIKYGMLLLKKDGFLIAYKSKDIDKELKKNSLPFQVFSKEVNGVERKLVIVKCHPEAPKSRRIS